MVFLDKTILLKHSWRQTSIGNTFRITWSRWGRKNHSRSKYWV